MSATIYYRRVGKRDPHLPVMAPSSFIEMMTRAFGWPCRVSKYDIPIIKGMMAASGLTNQEALEKLISVLEECEEVSLYAEY